MITLTYKIMQAEAKEYSLGDNQRYQLRWISMEYGGARVQIKPSPSSKNLIHQSHSASTL